MSVECTVVFRGWKIGELGGRGRGGVLGNYLASKNNDATNNT